MDAFRRNSGYGSGYSGLQNEALARDLDAIKEFLLFLKDKAVKLARNHFEDMDFFHEIGTYVFKSFHDTSSSGFLSDGQNSRGNVAEILRKTPDILLNNLSPDNADLVRKQSDRYIESWTNMAMGFIERQEITPEQNVRIFKRST